MSLCQLLFFILVLATVESDKSDMLTGQKETR